MSRSPVVAIYRELLLPYSETFIVEQARTLERYHPLYVGLRAVAGPLAQATEDTVVLGGHRHGVAWLAWKTIGAAHPRWIQAISAQKPRLLHAHFGRDALRGVTLARRLGIPAIATFHGYDVTVLPPWRLGQSVAAVKWRRYRQRLRELLRAGLTCVAVSGFIRDRLLALGARPECVHIRHIGIDVRRFQDPDAHRYDQRGARVLFVGRLVDKKGCRDLLAAVWAIQRERPVELTVIGDGPLRAELEAFARLHLRDARFLGARPPEAIRAELARARVFCVPSRTAADGDAEGFGMVFLEAQAMGVPVVSCASGGIPEAVADGVTGDLVTEGDVLALAARITRLLEDDDRWRSMSLAGRARTVDRFDLRTCTRALEDLYDQELSGSGVPIESALCV